MSDCGSSEPKEPKFECTFKELAQIALGCPEMKPINISALNSLLQALVTKINCQDDKLTLKGCQAKCGEELLKQADTMDVSRFVTEIELFTSLFYKTERINVLSERIQNAEKKLQDHLEDIVERTTMNSKKFNLNNWARYSNLTEDLCETPEAANEAGCMLVTNTHFIRRLARNIMTPILRRLKVIEEQLVENHKKMEKMHSKLRRHHEELNTVKMIIRDIELVREQMIKRQEVFMDTMKELQSILDCKVDKFHLPIIKKFLKDRFESFKVLIAELQTITPPFVGPLLLDNGRKCLSCGGPIDLVAGVRKTCQMPCDDLAAKKAAKIYTPEETCLCDYENFADSLLKPLLHRIEHMNTHIPITTPVVSIRKSLYNPRGKLMADFEKSTE